jgi:hypothetical protein
LQLELTVLYSKDAAICIDGVDRYAEMEDEKMMTADDEEKAEEGLWNSYTPVGKPVESSSKWWRSIRLTAQVPIVVLGEISSQPVEHYLKPEVASPIILASQADIVFPVVRPESVEEPIVNTSARLMCEGKFDPQQQWLHLRNTTRSCRRVPDPLVRYNAGDYAGLLWKKKIVAMERGILSQAAAEVEHGDQRHFVVAPHKWDTTLECRSPPTDSV